MREGYLRQGELFMNIAICDDNLQFVEQIENYLDEFDKFKIERDVFFQGEDLISMYEKNEAGYDAIFLDIEMGAINGIDVANRIRQLDKHTIIVFMTAYPTYMQKSFECSPFRFLIKPVRKDEFFKVIEAIDLKIRENPDTFIFVEKKVRVRVYSEDIVFFESKGHDIIVHMKDGNKHIVRNTITKLMEGIDKRIFVRVHRAFVVNMGHIHKINDKKVYMHGVENTIPMSRTYKQELTNAFIDFKERKYLL